MLLGALMHAGASLEEMRAERARLPLTGYTLEAQRVTKAGIAAVQAEVRVRERQEPRVLTDVTALIDGSSLPAADRDKGRAVFHRLAEAEAAVHGETVETVHLHDVGAVDAIVDVMGAVVGLRLLEVEELYCSPLPLGAGEVSGPHGSLPLPAPATLELLARANAPTRPGGEGEMVKPTGA